MLELVRERLQGVSSPVLVAAAVIVVIPLWLAFKYALTPKPLKGIPHLSHQDMVFGDGLCLVNWVDYHHTFTPWFESVIKKVAAKSSGGLAQIVFGFGAGGKMVIVTDSHEAEDILTRRTQEFDRAKRTSDGLKGLIPEAMIVMPSNAQWKHHRRVMGSTMTSKNLGLFAPRANRIIVELVDLWKAKAARLGPNGFFDSTDDFAHTMMDAICEITFGESYGAVANSLRLVKAKREFAGKAADGSADFKHKPVDLFAAMGLTLNSVPLNDAFPAISWLFIKRRPDYRAAIDLIDAFIGRKMQEGRDRAEARGFDKLDMVDCVLDLICAKEEGKDRLSDQSMRDELYQFLVAGQETSATTLSWAAIFLTQNPDVQRKLHKELLHRGLHDKVPTFADMTDENLPYLAAVIHESLRVANTLGATVRVATCNTVVLGKRIPKGTHLYFPISNFGNVSGFEAEDERLRAETSQAAPKLKPWDSATINVFDPERWLKPDGTFDGRAGPSFPFGVGARGCFGKALALVQMKLVVSGINLNFFLETPKAKQTHEFSEVITRKPLHSYVRPVAWP